ncbi:hypothetical protein PMCN06_1439 [Pasteurella multocida subsp. multocida str. HN06]|nr:hypothetical protein PMCN06_1439 [Pasteurella multocida subsp. multocida str. HN06]
MTYKANHRILHVKYSHLLALNGTFYGTFTAHLRHIKIQILIKISNQHS